MSRERAAMRGRAAARSAAILAVSLGLTAAAVVIASDAYGAKASGG
jgi:hypothetical protein